jgi:hypothetical protein
MSRRLTECALCGTVHDSVKDAMECCSARFEDDGDGDAGSVALPDGGSDLDAAAVQALERQADALEELCHRQRITNAALAELIRTVDRRAAEDLGREEPVAARTGRSVAGWIEDAALDLTERVDLAAVDMHAREDA